MFSDVDDAVSAFKAALWHWQLWPPSVDIASHHWVTRMNICIRHADAAMGGVDLRRTELGRVCVPAG